jgi:hypothetical protein
MHFEYWEKGSMSEGLWVLIPARKEGPTQEKVEELVRSEAMYIEGVAPLIHSSRTERTTP